MGLLQTSPQPEANTLTNGNKQTEAEGIETNA
jgi:hypothetical protein